MPGLFSLPMPARPRPAELATRFLFREIGAVIDRAAGQPGPESIFAKMLRELEIESCVTEQERDRVPASGPLVVAANHPFGLLEGAILAALCLRVRPDVKILANHLLPRRREVDDHFILVDPYERASSRTRNRIPLLHAARWLEDGGALIVFPAGDVSWPDLKRRAVADGAWNPAISRLIRSGRASVLPAFFPGANGPGFHALGLLHPRLRTLRLPSEFMNKRGRRVEVRIGRPLSFESLAQLDDERMIGHVRARTYVLAQRPAPPQTSAVKPAPADSRISAAIPLPSAHVLLDLDGWSVFLMSGRGSEPALREIGRLREAAFRDAGEGTGRACDLDEFDDHYDHLVLWNKAKGEIAGGYRLGRTQPILARIGPAGLYTSTLFQFRPGFFARLGPAIELGRSFVSPAYQRQYAPLFALWQGIGAYVCRHPECRFLFGAVSISARYGLLSRHILASNLLANASDPALAGLVAPRRPLRQVSFPGVGDDWKRLVIRDPEELSQLVADLEPDGKGMPVLLRQYLRLGGRMLAFSVDRSFSGVLDGLVVVDLLRTEPALLKRYLSPAGAASFLAFHQPAAVVS